MVAVAAGGNHSLALKTNGTVVAWGENTDAEGQAAGQSVVPLGLQDVVAIAARGLPQPGCEGRRHRCGVGR